MIKDKPNDTEQGNNLLGVGRGTYLVVQLLHESHLLSNSSTLILHSNSGWFYQHLIALRLGAP